MVSQRPFAVLLLLLGAAAALFACGLPGGFVLDDYVNLVGLERIGDSFARAAVFIAEAPTGFPGRPISYLSFALQHASWPDDPQAFKLVNIALHLANGALLFAWIAKALSLARDRRAAPTALIATAIWLIHPMQVSTVLYVVQRMAELAALFTFGAILAYLKGRALAADGRVRSGYAWMSAAVALGTPVAVLAKENGALLPLFIAVIELTLLSALPGPRGWRVWAAAFLAFPLIALSIYFALSPQLVWGYSMRAFDMAQRLFTEAGILWEYIAKILLPRPSAFGVYFDDYPVAAAPWQSFRTAAAIAGWCMALVAAIAWRKRLPFLSFAVLWFLAGHVLESSVFPLELYFEHRNYVPLVGPAMALAWGAVWLWDHASSSRVRRLYAPLGAAGLLAVAVVTWIEARDWADPLRQTVVWAQEHPASIRAQFELGSAYVRAGRLDDAARIFQRARDVLPEEAQFPLALVLLDCVGTKSPLPDPRELAHTFARGPLRPGTLDLLATLVERMEHGACPGVAPEYVLTVLGEFRSNPRFSGAYRAAALRLAGRAEAVRGNLDGAVRSLEAADRIAPDIVSVQLQAAWLLSAALYEDALRAIERGRRDPRWQPWQRIYFARFFDAWERQVREQAQRNGVKISARP